MALNPDNKIPTAASKNEIFVNINDRKVSYKDHNGITKSIGSYLAPEVDNISIIGDGTLANPLQATGQSTAPAAGVVLFADLATTEALKPCTYNNGLAGVGATLTGNANGALATVSFTGKIDNTNTALDQVILVRNQSNQTQNGLYLVTQLGDATTPFILTRTTDADTQDKLYPIQINILGGVSQTNLAYLQKTPDPIIGTNNIVFGTTTVGITNTPVLHVDTVTSAPLPICTYTSGTNTSSPGSGASLVADFTGALGTINGVNMVNGTRILVKDQLNKAHNGTYTVAAAGSLSAKWKLVRLDTSGGNFIYPAREWKVNNPLSTKYGARYSTDLLSLSNVNVGVTNLIFFEVQSALPSWLEYNGTDLTIWCNGQGDFSSNTIFGEAAFKTNATGIDNVAFGNSALELNTTGDGNAAVGSIALSLNTTGSYNTAIGNRSLLLNTTGSNNTALGMSTQSGNFSGSVIIGKDALATGNNQFVVGSVGTNAGTTTAEVITPDTTWLVRINGANYKIPMLLIP